MRILLIEDSATQAAITITELENIDPTTVQVKHALTLGEARSMLAEAQTRRATSFDLVVLDRTLPDGSGIEFCRELKTNEMTRELIVIVFSDERLTNLRKEAYEAGADFSVTKGDTGSMSLTLIVSTALRRMKRAS